MDARGLERLCWQEDDVAPAPAAGPHVAEVIAGVKHGESARPYQDHHTYRDHQDTGEEHHPDAALQQLGRFLHALRDLRNGAQLPTLRPGESELCAGPAIQPPRRAAVHAQFLATASRGRTQPPQDLETAPT